MKISAKVLARSVNDRGVELITMEWTYPRFILAEVNTHRVLTRNGASSRAIPFKRMVEAMRQDFAHPMVWLLNEPGMTATMTMPEGDADECDDIWLDAMEDAIKHAERLAAKNASKQYVNRLLEPFMMTKTLVSSTRWGNLIKLRNHKDAQPEFKILAECIVKELDESTHLTVKRSEYDHADGPWHLPYISDAERMAVRTGELGLDRVAHLTREAPQVLEAIVRFACVDARTASLLVTDAARCARTSYKTWDGEVPTFAKDVNTFIKLYSDPLHASPLEHQARARDDSYTARLTGNFHGWNQFRKWLPGEAIDESWGPPLGASPTVL
jgi:hypothetical protein